MLNICHPHVILGTMNFGGQVDERTADQMVRIFLDHGGKELDTANRYCNGLTEEILGKILAPSLRKDVYLATKVTPHGEGLRPDRVIKQLEISLRRLKTDYVDLLYLHAPDPKTPIEKTLEACEKLFRQGKFRDFGLSNYAAWQVVDIWHICNQKGWRAPVVYQGMYNAITRDVERELFPALRTVGIKFYAYNPLAGGFLTGKYLHAQNEPSDGRFALNPAYVGRYWKENHFAAVDLIRRTCEANELMMADCALRWLIHHSFLRNPHKDGYIIAATSLDQFKGNLESCSGKELPESLIRIFDDAWEVVRPECPCYFRS